MLSAQPSAAGQGAPPGWPSTPPDQFQHRSAAAASGASASSLPVTQHHPTLPHHHQLQHQLPPPHQHISTSPQGQDIPAPSDAASAASHQALFPRLSPEAAELFAGTASSSAAAAAVAAAQQQQHQQQQLKQNLQKLYGSLGLQHGSRSSLPDIQEDEPQTSLPSDPPLASAAAAAARLPPFGRPPTARTLSDEDLFGMQDLHHHGHGAHGHGQQQAAAVASSSSTSGAGAAGGRPQVAAAAALRPPPAAADLSLVGQLPAGATQSRTLFVRNVDPSVSEEELRTLFEAFGEVRSLYTAAKARGFVVVGYYDTRAATLAKHTLSGQALAGQQLDVHFSLPKDDREASQGTLLVASLDASSSRQELLYLFSQYGELREVRDDPMRSNCCLVEFYDMRHAAAALQGISQSPDMTSRLVVMEASAAALPQAAPAASAAPSLGSSLSHDYLASLPGAAAAGQYGGAPGMGAASAGLGMRNVGSSPALLYGSTHGSSNQLDYLLAGGGGTSAAAALQQQQHQQAAAAAAAAAGAGGGGYDSATAQLLSAAGLSAASLSAAAAASDPMLASMNRSFSEMSLDSSSVAAAGLGGRYAPSSLSTGDLMAMTQSLQGAAGAAGLRGIASTGSIWPHHQQASLGSSPVGAGVWPPALGPAAGSHNSLQDLLQKQAAVNAALHQQAAVNAALLQQQSNPLAVQSAAALQAAMQQALLTQQAAALLGHGGLQAAGLLGAAGRRGVEAPLGGRLARRPLDPVAEAERRMQQEKLYSLDLNKIRLGEDKRTTLMVKNIPNKYTQKMLLALVEERFRGMFDFFYLPIDFKNKCNVGYAFINMVRPEYIIPLVEELHGKKWPKFNSEKICHIAYGRIQGKAALVQHFQNSSLLHEDKRCRPILFHTNGALAGEVEQFPGTLPSPSVTPAPTGASAAAAAAAAAAATSVPLMAAASAAAAAAAAVGQPTAVAAPAAAPPQQQQGVLAASQQQHAVQAAPAMEASQP